MKTSLVCLVLIVAPSLVNYLCFTEEEVHTSAPKLWVWYPTKGAYSYYVAPMVGKGASVGGSAYGMEWLPARQTKACRWYVMHGMTRVWIDNPHAYLMATVPYNPCQPRAGR